MKIFFAGVFTLLPLASGCSLVHPAPPAFLGSWDSRDMRSGMYAFSRITFKADGTGQEYVDVHPPGVDGNPATTYPFTWHQGGGNLVIQGGYMPNVQWSVTDDGKILTLTGSQTVNYNKVADSTPLPKML